MNNIPKKFLDFAEDVGYTPSKVEIALAKFITVDKDMLRMKEKVKLLAKDDCDLPVLILGETGTGKELIARALHSHRTGRFIDVNCAGLPDTLIESEFFGTTPGAFTGSGLRQGYLEQAARGTLFLDEIGDMPLLLQAKLLRVLQERKAKRLGGNDPYDVTCRFVAATNRTEIHLATSKEIRQDIYHRLAGSTLKIKPLHERPEDIELIALSHLNNNKADAEELTCKFIGMSCYGNVRGLLNLIADWKIEQQLGKLES